MKSKPLGPMLLLLVPLGGCAVPASECVWTDTLYYDSTDVVDWLSRNDPSLLTDVTAHNEKREEFCR